MAVIAGALLVAVGFALGVVSERVGGTADSQTAPSAVDTGFLQDMSVHHHQAIEMSAAILTTTEDAEVRNLAFDILTGQENQIGQMHGWLQIWDEPLLPLNGFMGWMEAGDHAGHMEHSGPMAQMPGMASPAEMAELRAAQGTERDVLFLQLMLRHHDGGIPMMEYAIEHADVPVVRNIASSMLEGQTKEIGLITAMLDQRGAEPLPMN
ncbi:putative secreted protein [Hoyosella subflava DQS3-9A1]|uniref:Putative secreted protein n=1 Tax=Hoyosella subflava (strain DSM 45089 / JCM 17490 / NBRC 109087 / DQS3-9A1) TaxID=443218 RepID=F6EP59_HOYSD|nr:putative secreted protein [Hoyosella subflava DQS3-9A1]